MSFGPEFKTQWNITSDKTQASRQKRLTFSHLMDALIFRGITEWILHVYTMPAFCNTKSNTATWWDKLMHTHINYCLKLNLIANCKKVVSESSPVPPLSLQEPPGHRPLLLSMMERRRTAWTWARWWWTRKWGLWFWSTASASTSTNATLPAPWWWRAGMTAEAGASPETSRSSLE